MQDLYAVEGFSYQEKISVRKLKLLASNFSTVFAVLQGLPGSLPWGVLLTFLNDFLSQHKGMSISQATLVRTLLRWHPYSNLRRRCRKLPQTRQQNSHGQSLQGLL